MNTEMFKSIGDHLKFRPKRVGLVLAPLVVGSLALSGCAGQDGTIEPVNYNPTHIIITGSIDIQEASLPFVHPDGTYDLSETVPAVVVFCQSDQQVNGNPIEGYSQDPIINGYTRLTPLYNSGYPEPKVVLTKELEDKVRYVELNLNGQRVADANGTASVRLSGGLVWVKEKSALDPGMYNLECKFNNNKVQTSASDTLNIK